MCMYTFIFLAFAAIKPYFLEVFFPFILLLLLLCFCVCWKYVYLIHTFEKFFLILFQGAWIFCGASSAQTY